MGFGSLRIGVKGRRSWLRMIHACAKRSESSSNCHVNAVQRMSSAVFHQIEARASIVSRRGFDGPLFRGGGLLIPTTNWPEPLIAGLLILTKHLTGT